MLVHLQVMETLSGIQWPYNCWDGFAWLLTSPCIDRINPHELKQIEYTSSLWGRRISLIDKRGLITTEVYSLLNG